ncbi:hypothetical protein [Bradyrhizobium guangdongense]|uniref:hypothetical protein n=1 Tax=Bradyrhizobium guangdongense TaxID=1325090 RepID=UPI001319E8A3|nr:hypothetical protein [Bradyrhizobium guangdongense]
MNKFASLAADVSKPFRVELIDPVTEEVIRDNSKSVVDPTDPDGLRMVGKAAYIEIWAADGEKGRAFDKADRKALMLRIKQARNGKVEPDDALEKNIAKCAALTASWYLVDRLTGEPIDVPCTVENAADLYSPPGMGWIFVQPWVAANDVANFLPRPSKSSTATQKPSSEPDA